MDWFGEDGYCRKARIFSQSGHIAGKEGPGLPLQTVRFDKLH